MNSIRAFFEWLGNISPLQQHSEDADLVSDHTITTHRMPYFHPEDVFIFFDEDVVDSEFYVEQDR